MSQKKKVILKIRTNLYVQENCVRRRENRNFELITYNLTLALIKACSGCFITSYHSYPRIQMSIIIIIMIRLNYIGKPHGIHYCIMCVRLNLLFKLSLEAW